MLCGSSDTSFRRQVQNRPRFLLSFQEKHLDEFFDICREYDLVKEADDSKQSPARSTAALPSTAESNQSPELHDQQSPPPPPPASMSHRRSILPALPDIEEIILNLDQPEQNCNGMLVLKTVDIMVGDTEQIDVITIFKPLYDPRDIKNIKAVLDADGGAIALTEPVVSCYFLEEVKEMHTLECWGNKRLHPHEALSHACGHQRASQGFACAKEDHSPFP
jgi:hypothetical protein